MFDVFGDSWLSHINTTASPEDIDTFKRSYKTKKAFKCLFENDDDGNLPYIQAIKDKAWGKRKTTTEKDTAFTLAVCEVVLNPNHSKISISDSALRKRFDVYLVYINSLLKYLVYMYNN